MFAIASNSRRPMVAHSRSHMLKTGEQMWGRDPYHLVSTGGERACFDEEARTLCGRKTYGWTTPWEVTEIDHNCCERCAAKL